MSGKAKPAKHTAKEIAMKDHEAKMKKGGRGGGEEGKENRKAPKDCKKNVYVNCRICFTQQTSVKSMQLHYESKHPKEDWEEAKLQYEEEINANKEAAYAKREERDKNAAIKGRKNN